VRGEGEESWLVGIRGRGWGLIVDSEKMRGKRWMLKRPFRGPQSAVNSER